MKVDPSRLHRLFYPQVPLVLCARLGSRVSAMPVVAYVPISDSPPLLGVACGPQAFTFKLSVKAHAFSLSVLDRRSLKAMERLATVSGAKVEDKLAQVGLRYRPGSKTGAPIIADSVATIECSLFTKHKLGDHVLLVGRVESSYASEDFSDFWDFGKYKPILYTGWRDGMTTYVEG
jgi:flavin reductase (DIM6/NTAB) family NADH-FMN oxidoreductase RutF